MISTQTLKHEEVLVITYQTTGCSKAYGKLYELFYQSLFDYVCKFADSTEDAFDITQDTFIHASTEVHKLRQPITFRFWLFRIARNMCMRKHRIDNKNRWESYEEGNFSQDYDIIEALEKDQELEKLSMILSTMPQEDQELLIAKYVDGASIKNLMDSTGQGSSAIKMKLMRSRLRLQKEMALAI